MDGFNRDEKTDLCRIMAANRSDKGNPDIYQAWHNYTIYYDKIFSPWRERPLRIFELGLGTNDTSIESNMGENGRPGASLFGWREYFPNASIFGADIDKKILFEFDRIQTFYCNQTSPEDIQVLWQQPSLAESGFDIMIDDGLHKFQANKCFFENSIHKLNPGGFYIIEDVTNYRDKEILLKEINNVWKPRFSHLTFEFLELPSYWNDLDNNVVVIRFPNI